MPSFYQEVSEPGDPDFRARPRQACSLDRHAPSTVLSYGGGLRRVAGVSIHNLNHMNGKLDASCLDNYLEAFAAVTSGCPNLRELGIIGSLQVSILLGGFLES